MKLELKSIRCFAKVARLCLLASGIYLATASVGCSMSTEGEVGLDDGNGSGSEAARVPGSLPPLLGGGDCSDFISLEDQLMRPEVGMIAGTIVSVEPVLDRIRSDEESDHIRTDGTLCTTTAHAALRIQLEEVETTWPIRRNTVTIYIDSIDSEEWALQPTLRPNSPRLEWHAESVEYDQMLPPDRGLRVAFPVATNEAGDIHALGFGAFEIAEDGRVHHVQQAGCTPTSADGQDFAQWLEQIREERGDVDLTTWPWYPRRLATICRN